MSWVASVTALMLSIMAGDSVYSPSFGRRNREDMMLSTPWNLLRSAALYGIAFCALTAGAHAQSAGSWTMKAPLPAALNEVAVAYAGGKIHVIGGSVLGFTGPYHQDYDPATDKWRVRSPLPRSLDHVGS